MIFTDLSTNYEHFIDYKGLKIPPNVIVILPLRRDETLPIEGDFTCLFNVRNLPSMNLEPLCFEYFSDKKEINFNKYTFKGVYPKWGYVFKGQLDLEYFNNRYFKSEE